MSQFISVIAAFSVVVLQGPEVMGDYITPCCPLGKRSRSSKLLKKASTVLRLTSLKLPERLS